MAKKTDKPRVQIVKGKYGRRYRHEIHVDGKPFITGLRETETGEPFQKAFWWLTAQEEWIPQGFTETIWVTSWGRLASEEGYNHENEAIYVRPGAEGLVLAKILAEGDKYDRHTAGALCDWLQENADNVRCRPELLKLVVYKLKNVATTGSYYGN